MGIDKKYEKNDNRIISIRMNHRSKPSGARNAALEVAKGKYIHFVMVMMQYLPKVTK